MKKLGSIIFFLISCGVLSVFVAFSYGSDASFTKQYWWSFCSVILAVVFVLLFCVTTWILLEELHERKIVTNGNKLPDIPSDKRDVHLTRLNHVEAEVTRYRDLSWKIAGLVWAIYYVLKEAATTKSGVNPLNEPLYLFFLFCAAASGTIFLLFCEWNAKRNRIHRRELGEKLSLHERWNFTQEGENFAKPGFWFPVGVFILAVWAPPFVILFQK